MKKIIILLLLMVVLTTGAFAFEVGGGIGYHQAAQKSFSNHDFGIYGFLGGKFFNFEMNYLIPGGGTLGFGNDLFGYGLFFKVPFKIGEKVRLFPTFGLTSTFRRFKWLIDDSLPFKWFFDYKVGIGIDFHFTEIIFLRGTALYMLPFFERPRNYYGLDFKAAIGFGF